MLRITMAMLITLGLAAAFLIASPTPSSAATLDSRVTFRAEQGAKPKTCVYGRLTAQGSAGRPQGIPGKTVLIQKKKSSGWRTVAKAKTGRNGSYGKCVKIGFGKQKGHYRVAVRGYSISKGYKGSRYVSRSLYFW
ncbi:hypothetical protein [Microlunatus soli]|uniref:Uncharacterized protein n=1 Tax=Microlunatus soli TaxID=630515 RepID=A0A1H1U1U8_9ACTN|nr:hypothetical protein [Microlunatus soli]SDS66344.1 hypothetical protein SAMN04489812_2604 [Microlunatus soli]